MVIAKVNHMRTETMFQTVKVVDVLPLLSSWREQNGPE
jgi:hypothetical protein